MDFIVENSSNNINYDQEYTIYKDLELANEHYNNLKKEIIKYLEEFDYEIYFNINKIEDNYNLYTKKIDIIEKNFKFLDNLKFRKIIINLLENKISNEIDFKENIYDFKSKEYVNLFLELKKKYEKILEKNIKKLLKNNNGSIITKIFLNYVKFNNKNFEIKVLEIPIIKDLLLLIKLENSIDNNYQSIINFIDNLTYNSEYVYNKVNLFLENFNFCFNINIIENYQKKFSKSNEYFLKLKNEILDHINLSINEINELKLFDYQVDFYNIINNKQKCIEIIYKKENFIKNNVNNFNEFEILYNNYNIIKKNIESKKKVIEEINNKLCKLEDFLLSDEIVNLDKNFIINKKKLRLDSMNSHNLKMNNQEKNEDLVDYNNNKNFLENQKKNLSKLLTNKLEIENNIIKNKDIISELNKVKNKDDIIINNKNRKNKDKLKNKNIIHQNKLDELKYEIIYVKNNIQICLSKIELLDKKKIISENIITKINKNINNFNSKNENLVKNYELLKKNLENDYRLKKNMKGKNNLLKEDLLNQRNQEQIELEKLNVELSHYISILETKYNRFYLLKNKIYRIVKLLLEIEKKYEEYNEVIKKLNNNNVSFLESFYQNNEIKYLEYIYNYIIKFDNLDSLNLKSDLYKLIKIYGEVINFYRSNYFYIYNLNIIEIILNIKDKKNIWEEYIKINQSDYDYYTDKTHNFICEFESVRESNKKKELEDLINKTKKFILNMNKYSLYRNNLIKISRLINNNDICKIDKYLNDIK